MKSCIHFIRHGKKEGTEKKWYYGAADLPLIEEGIADTKRLAEEGIYPDGSDALFFTTAMSRAKHTLELIYGDVEYVEIPQMNEMDFGAYECRPFAELEDDAQFLEWCNDETGDYALEGGESKNQFGERIKEGLTLLRKYHGLKELSHRHSGKDANSIIACHGGTISACMTLMFPSENKNIWQWCPKPGHGYTVYFENGEPIKYEAF